LGQAAIEAGLTVAWFTIEDLGALVRRHRVDDSITRLPGQAHPHRPDHDRGLGHW
jgi:hypothetical protein